MPRINKNFTIINRKRFFEKTYWRFGIFLILIFLISIFLIVYPEAFDYSINFIQENVIDNLANLDLVDPKNISTQQKAIIILYFSFLGLIADFLFLIWSFFRERIVKRYISRNTRLYINYLLDRKGFVKQLEEENKS